MRLWHSCGTRKFFGRRNGKVERVGDAINDIEESADEDGILDSLIADSCCSQREDIRRSDSGGKQSKFLQEAEHGPYFVSNRSRLPVIENRLDKFGRKNG